MNKGRTDEFRITVLQLVPDHYVLLDGAHRICAWQVMRLANPELPDTYPAQVIAPTLSMDQMEIISGGKNDLPNKVNDLLDTVSNTHFDVHKSTDLLVLDEAGLLEIQKRRQHKQGSMDSGCAWKSIPGQKERQHTHKRLQKIIRYQDDATLPATCGIDDSRNI